MHESRFLTLEVYIGRKSFIIFMNKEIVSENHKHVSAVLCCQGKVDDDFVINSYQKYLQKHS